jgi:hypothetical protein
MKILNEDEIEWMEKENSRSSISRMSKNIKARKFSYKGGKKKTIPLYSRNYVKDEKGDRNKKKLSKT